MANSTSTYQDVPPTEPAAHEHNSVQSERGRVRVKGDAVDVGILRQPLILPFSGRTVMNRLMKAPMTERLCHWNKHGEDISKRGYPSKEYFELYERWGEGEIGIIVFGNTMVQYDAVEAFGNPIICDDHDGRIAKYAEVVKVSKAHGSLAICQLSSPGRQAPAHVNTTSLPMSASDVKLDKEWAGHKFLKPRPMTHDDIKELVQRWGEASYLCHEAGFDGVQIHCAHGYLLAQFLSPTTNLRDDEYGGSLENRSRIIFEIIEEIRRRVPDPTFILCVKLNSVEFQDRGQTTDDFLGFATKLSEHRIDFLDISGGTFEGRAFHHVKESTKKREAYFIEFAEMLRPLAKRTRLFITGGLRSAGAMVRAVESGACDGIGMARPIAAEPYICKEILGGRISGSIENYNQLPNHTQAAGTQLHQVGHGHEKVSDWSVEEEVKRWEDANEVEQKRKASILPVVDASGYPTLLPQHAFAYLR